MCVYSVVRVESLNIIQTIVDVYRPYRGSGCKSLASVNGSLSSIRGQCTWDSWWLVRHRERFFCKYFGVTLVSLVSLMVPIHHHTCFFYQNDHRASLETFQKENNTRSEIGRHWAGMQFHCFLARVAKLPKASSCLFAGPHGTTSLPLDRFSWNLIFEHFSKICDNIQV